MGKAGVNKDEGAKEFTLTPNQKPIRIGRAPGNDLVLAYRGVSQYHAEVRLLKGGLAIRDLSMNGTGLKKGGGSQQPALLQKNTDEPLLNGCEVWVPMMLKENAPPSERGVFIVQYLKGGAADAETPQPPAATEEDGDADAEKKRMQFVELLLKTREVNAGTKYEEAKALLGTNAAWKDV